MLYILTGQDDFSLAGSLAEIKRQLGDEVSLAANTSTLDGQQLTLDQLRSVCETAPFLATRRLAIVRGLLERFEPRRSRQPEPRGSRGGITHPLSQDKEPEEYQPFASLISRLPDSTVLVLIENRLSRANPLFRQLATKAVVKTFPLLRESELRRWIERRLAAEGGSLSPQAIALLVRLVGSNLFIMASEINKLVLFAAGRRIEEEDIKTVVSDAQQVSVFALVDAIVEFRTEIAEQMLEQLLQRGAAPAYLLAMLLRQIRMVVRARELKSQGKTNAEVQDRLGLVAEFAVRKTLEQASRYSLARLKEVYHQLLGADLSIKTGKYAGELALNILVAELCRQGRRSPSQSLR